MQPARMDLVPGKRYVIASVSQKDPTEWKCFMLNSDNKQDLPEILVNWWSKDCEVYAQILQENALFVCHGKGCQQQKIVGKSMFKM